MSNLDGTEQAFATTAAAVRGTADIVEVEGPEAESYLQGQLSQDVVGLASGSSAMSLLLQPQGKIEAWMRLTRLGDDRFWLDLPTGFGEATVARLDRFKLRTKASIRLLAAQVVSVRGPDAAAGAEALGFTVPAGGAVLDALWPGTEGFDVVDVSGSPGGAVGIPDGVDEGPPEALEALRIGLGIPAMGAELTTKTIPAAAGIVDWSVDFTKGCYVGQELVARIDSRGSNTPTRLRVFSLDHGWGGASGGVSVGAEVVHDGSVVGSLTSVAARSRSGLVALGYVKRSVEVPATAEVVADDGHHVTAEVTPVPSSVSPS